MVDAPELFKNFARVIFTIPGLAVLISLLYFAYLYLEDELELSDMLRNSAIVAACSLGVLYARKYVLSTYGKVSGFQTQSTPVAQSTDFIETVIPDKTLGIPSF